jgi:hypothetical protein
VSTPDRPPAPVEVAGWIVTARGGRVYVQDAWRGREGGLWPGEASALATAIQTASEQAERQHQHRRADHDSQRITSQRKDPA